MAKRSDGGASPSDEARDALIQIKGIGQRKREWLQDELNIWSIQDLANASAESIYSQLREGGHQTSRKEIQDWIAQAKKLSAEQPEQKSDVEQNSSQEEEVVSLEDKAVSQDINETQSTTQSLEGGHESEASDWSTITTFSVNFQLKSVGNQVEAQTEVRHLETNESQVWPDANVAKLQEWILERVQAATQQLKTRADLVEDIARTMQTASAKLTVRQIKLMQPVQTGIPLIVGPDTSATAAFIQANVPFSLELLLELQGAEINSLVSRETTLIYKIQLGAKRLTAPRENVVAEEISSLSLIGEGSLYRAALNHLSLQTGLYTIEILISLPRLYGCSTYAEVPRLQVV
jgi:hypothetical protein